MAKKRSSGEGSIWKTGTSSWRGQLMDGYHDNGKKRIINFSAPTRGEVVDKIRTYQIGGGNEVKLEKGVNLDEWSNTWYEDYRSQVQPSTYAGYRYTLKLIQSHLGDRSICDIMPIHINRFLDQLVAEEYSLSLIRKCRAMLVQIFRSAEDNDLILRNPAQRAKSIKVLHRGGEALTTKDAYTPEEVKELMYWLSDTIIGHSIRIMLVTGLRVQELIALSHQDIGEDGATIRVNKAIQMVNGLPNMGPPKSRNGYRSIPIPTQYRSSALYLRNKCGDSFLWRGRGDSPYYTVGSFRRRYYTEIEKMPNVRKLPPHCCRHTYITQLQAKGVPLETIAKLAGHGDMATTGIYLHLSADTLERAVDVLNE